MLDLTKVKGKLPRGVTVRGSFFYIKTDFNYFILFSRLMKQHAPVEAFDIMYKGAIPADRVAGVLAINSLFNAPNELPRKTGNESGEIVLDYDLDADLIYSAFMEQYGIDLFAKPLHFAKFRALLSGLHNTQLNDVIGYRLYKNTGKNDEFNKSRQQLRDAWRIIPENEENDAENDEDLNYFENLLK